MLLVAVQQSDGLEIESVFQSLCPSFDVPVLTSPSGWKRGEQAVARGVNVLDDLFLPSCDIRCCRCAGGQVVCPR